MKKLLPVILAVVGLGAGLGAGIFLKPAPEEHAEGEMPEEGKEGISAGEDHGGEYMAADAGASHGKEESAPYETAMVADIPYDPEAVWEYVKLPKQFVVPLIKKDRVAALVVMSISLEVVEGASEEVLGRQPKLRDAFLQVLFAHSNSGGFDGAFTTGQSMRDLRGSLLEVAERIVGPNVHSVLIEEIVKQQN